MGHGGDIIAELTADHGEVEEIFRALERTPSGDPRRRELVDQVVIELVRHSVAEEQYLYPAVREHLENGDTIADKELADHAEVEEIMKELEGTEVDDPRFDPLVDRLIADIRLHLADEEGNLFPALRHACSEEELRRLGDRARMARWTAPVTC